MKVKAHEVLSTKTFRLVDADISSTLELGEATDINAHELIAGTGWTLQGFDPVAGVANFFDVGEGADLFRTAFCYTAQHRAARRYASVPLAHFLELAGSIQSRHHFVHLFNIGHCGSTLLHHVINASGEAWDISEPRFCFDLAWYRDALTGGQQVALAKAGLAFLSLFPLAAERSTIVVKHFSQGTKSYGLWHAATPHTKNLYMYRDALGWCNSVYGFAQRMSMPTPMPRDMRNFIWNIQTGKEPVDSLDGILDLESDDVRFEDLAACSWSLHAKEFEAARESGINFHAFRYNELLQNRAGVLRGIFVHCGLDPRGVETGLAAFDRDAHAGEEWSQDQKVVRLDAEANARVVALLRHPRLNTDPDLQF
jgi:hypothetical protein